MIRRTTWIVLALFVALLAFFFWQRSKQAEPVESSPTPGLEYLFDLDANIIGIRISSANHGVVELDRGKEGLWELVWPKGEETDIGAVEAAVTQLLSLRVVTALEQPLDLEDAGLKDPAYGLLLLLDDGSQVYANIGKVTPTGSGYYILVSDHTMSVVDKYSLDAVLKLVSNPPIKPTATATPETEPSETSTPLSDEDPTLTPTP